MKEIVVAWCLWNCNTCPQKALDGLDRYHAAEEAYWDCTKKGVLGACAAEYDEMTRLQIFASDIAMECGMKPPT